MTALNLSLLSLPASAYLGVESLDLSLTETRAVGGLIAQQNRVQAGGEERSML